MSENQKSTARLSIWQGFLLLILFVLFVPAILLWLLLSLVAKVAILLCVWLSWGLRGKDMLVVYSDSPYWKSYFENGLLPQIKERSVTLNWSTRSQWRKPELRTMVFHLFGGEREFNPMIFLFVPFRWPQRFRFYQPFKDFKHGKEQSLRKLEHQLFNALDESLANPHPRPFV